MSQAKRTMVEILTGAKLMESLCPFDSEELFVCVRDEKGRLLSIVELTMYLETYRKREEE